MEILTEKNIYDPLSSKDGTRILVMRGWPRGIKKEAIDKWVKELGTHKDLVDAWKTNTISWAEFKKRYKKSLEGKEEYIQEIADEAKRNTITLLCSCKDEKHCHRTILKEIILEG